MLEAGNDAGALDALDRLTDQGPGEDRIVAETLPVATSCGNTAQRAYDRTKDNIEALLGKLGAQARGALQRQLLVPATSRVSRSLVWPRVVIPVHVG